MDTRD